MNRNAIEECPTCGNRWFVWEKLSECPYCAISRMKANDRPECLTCHHRGAFAPDCCSPNPAKCESCGFPLVQHLGLTGTCAEKTRYLSLLRRVIRMSCLTVERCPAGYPDVAAFLREEARQASTASTMSTPEAPSGQ